MSQQHLLSGDGSLVACLTTNWTVDGSNTTLSTFISLPYNFHILYLYVALVLPLFLLFLQLLAFPCGIIRGCLAGLGVSAAVTVDVTAMPACELSLWLSLCPYCYVLPW